MVGKKTLNKNLVLRFFFFSFFVIFIHNFSTQVSRKWQRIYVQFNIFCLDSLSLQKTVVWIY